MTSSLFQIPISFENFKILYFWTDLAEIWLRGQILGADSESEVMFHIKPILTISGNFASEKVTATP